MIRIGLFLLLAIGVLFFIHRMWGTEIAHIYLNEPSPDEQFAPIDPLIYSESVDAWSLTRANFSISQNAKSAAAQETGHAETLIEALQ